MKLPRRVGATPVIAAAVTALIAGGTYALAAGGTIHSCADKSNGALRLARKCKKSERSVTWNVQGPQGIQGRKGDTGPIGPSNAYSSFKNPTVSVTSSSLTTVARLSIPAAGNYVINAKVVLHDDVNTPVDIQCQLVVAGTNLDQSETALTGNSAGFVNHETAALQAVDQFTAAGEVDLQCAGFGVNTDASLAKITAVQVGSLTNAPSS
jgi:hypothetical protein